MLVPAFHIVGVKVRAARKKDNDGHANCDPNVTHNGMAGLRATHRVIPRNCENAEIAQRLMKIRQAESIPAPSHWIEKAKFAHIEKLLEDPGSILEGRLL